MDRCTADIKPKISILLHRLVSFSLRFFKEIISLGLNILPKAEIHSEGLILGAGMPSWFQNKIISIYFSAKKGNET